MLILVKSLLLVLSALVTGVNTVALLHASSSLHLRLSVMGSSSAHLLVRRRGANCSNKEILASDHRIRSSSVKGLLTLKVFCWGDNRSWHRLVSLPSLTASLESL